MLSASFGGLECKHKGSSSQEPSSAFKINTLQQKKHQTARYTEVNGLYEQHMRKSGECMCSEGCGGMREAKKKDDGEHQDLTQNKRQIKTTSTTQARM